MFFFLSKKRYGFIVQSLRSTAHKAVQTISSATKRHGLSRSRLFRFEISTFAPCRKDPKRPPTGDTAIFSRIIGYYSIFARKCLPCFRYFFCTFCKFFVFFLRFSLKYALTLCFRGRIFVFSEEIVPTTGACAKTGAEPFAKFVVCRSRFMRFSLDGGSFFMYHSIIYSDVHRKR